MGYTLSIVTSKTGVCLKHFLEFVPGNVTVSEDLSKESAPNRLTLVHGYNRAPPVWMAQEMVTAPRPNNFKTKFPKGFDKSGTCD